MKFGYKILDHEYMNIAETEFAKFCVDLILWEKLFFF